MIILNRIANAISSFADKMYKLLQEFWTGLVAVEPLYHIYILEKD